jgi:hypothetical protein
MQDLQPMCTQLQQLLGLPPNGQQAIGTSRALRRECMTWLRANQGQHRASTLAVIDLLRRANDRWVRAVEANPHFAQAAPPIPELPTAALLRNIRAPGMPGNGLGNAMRPKYDNEMVPPHWTPKTFEAKEASYAHYLSGGGTLTRLAWQTLIIAPSLEDDRNGEFLRDGEVRSFTSTENVSPAGILYLDTDQARAPYRVEIRNGVLYDAGNQPLDTQNLQVDGYGFGWGLFVLGFDNRLYVGGEIREIFHHSSFFAGGAVQCGGELCCINGQLCYLTCKAGHYRSGRMEFYRLIAVLQNLDVPLDNVLVVPSPKDLPYKWYRALDWFVHDHGPGLAPVRQGVPVTQRNPGVPSLP